VKVTQEVNDAPLPVAFDTLNLSADLHNNRAELGWLIRLTNNGQFDGRFKLPTRRDGVIWAATSISATSTWRW
jgi:autotransporter translocation and assembly factor TamB